VKGGLWIDNLVIWRYIKANHYSSSVA